MKFVTYPGNSKENRNAAWRNLGTVKSNTNTNITGTIRARKTVNTVLPKFFLPTVLDNIRRGLIIRLYMGALALATQAAFEIIDRGIISGYTSI